MAEEEEENDLTESETSWLVELGERLKLARDRAGMRQETVSESLGYPTRSLTRWENGKCDPGFEKIARLGELYGVSADWLAGRTSITQCIRPGMVMIDNAAREVLESLVREGGTVADVPRHLIRGPGIDYAAVVPESPNFVGEHAAEAIETRIRALWRQLGGEPG